MSGLITRLASNEVFVFGANSTGFHGAGAAGYVMRGTAANTWREDEAFLRAMRAPVGHPDRIGRWAVYGIARGWQQGREGMSYAIQTIEKPGMKRSTPLAEIKAQFVGMITFCRAHPEWTFKMTEVGAGLSGWTEDEMAETFLEALGGEIRNAPSNLIIPMDLYGWNWSTP